MRLVGKKSNVERLKELGAKERREANEKTNGKTIEARGRGRRNEKKKEEEWESKEMGVKEQGGDKIENEEVGKEQLGLE